MNLVKYIRIYTFFLQIFRYQCVFVSCWKSCEHLYRIHFVFSAEQHVFMLEYKHKISIALCAIALRSAFFRLHWTKRHFCSFTSIEKKKRISQSRSSLAGVALNRKPDKKNIHMFLWSKPLKQCWALRSW